MDHYIGLFVAYGAIVGLRLAVSKLYPQFITTPRPLLIEKPGKELIYLLFTLTAILGVGQLYTAGMLLPKSDNWEGATESINQILIFSPVFLFFLLVKPSPISLFLVREHLARRIGLGAGLAVIALLVFWMATPADISLTQLFSVPLNLKNIDIPVQVFFEDLLIAMCLARLCKLLSLRKTIILVAAVFAAAHIPAFIAQGDTLFDLMSLIADAALAVMVFGTILKTRDFIWIFPVHFVLDTTQFHF